MLTSERIDAARAERIGLVNEVVPAEELMEQARQRIAAFASGPSVAYSYIKDNLDEALNIDHQTAIDREADRLMKARTTQDHKEAVRAFAEKRKPKFTGK